MLNMSFPEERQQKEPSERDEQWRKFLTFAENDEMSAAFLRLNFSNSLFVLLMTASNHFW